jgi:hypothetical protein
MRTISQYIEECEPGDVIPAIKGEILKTKFLEDTQVQNIIIGTPEDNIKLVIKKVAWIIEPKVGNVLSLTSTGGKKSPIDGLTLKRNKTSGIKYIIVSTGAKSEQEISVTESSSTVVDEEPMTASDSVIDNYVMDRLYIFQRVSKVIETVPNIHYPIEKAAELATAVHIELSRKGISPRPSDKQLERKATHAAKKEEAAPKKESTKSGWRAFKHPLSGVPLGDESADKIQKVFIPWRIRTDPDTLTKAGMPEYHRMVGEAARELEISNASAAEAYMLAHIQEFEPNAARQAKVLSKFTKGLVKLKLAKDPDQLTDSEGVHLIKHFKQIWNQLMESDE